MTINNIIYENEFNSIKNTLIIVYENTLIAINRTLFNHWPSHSTSN